jgi:hypothetical protein
VIEFVRGGGGKSEAARRFQVSRASVYHWTNAPNGLAYQRPGPKGPRRLDWQALRQDVATPPGPNATGTGPPVWGLAVLYLACLAADEAVPEKNAGVPGK